MPYLYGDSSSSQLEVNYIQLLRDALDFSVEVLLAIHRIRKWEDSKRDRLLAAELEIQRMRDLEENLSRVLEGSGAELPDNSVGRCASAIQRQIAGSVASEIAAVRSGLEDDRRRMDGEIQRERQSCVRALEALLLAHDLPDASRGIHVLLDEGGRYRARLLESALHLESVVELEIPPDHVLAQPLKVERLVDPLEVQAPEKRGWLHKRVKIVPQSLSRLYITEIQRGTSETTIRLRATPDPGDSGFDIVIADEAPRVTLMRVSKEAGESPGPFQPEPGDGDKLLLLFTRLDQHLAALASSRKQLLDATLDDKPLDQHDNPAILVERLVTSMSPVIREIDGHSLTPGELVLKRVLADDRREEIFVSKADLERNLGRLPSDLRALFAPLGLGQRSLDTSAGLGFEEETTSVSTPSGAQPRTAREPAVEASTGDDDSEVIPIDDNWLEEPSTVTGEHGAAGVAQVLRDLGSDLDAEPVGAEE